MPKKRKSQEQSSSKPSDSTKQISKQAVRSNQLEDGENTELEVVSKKEINATLDMLIRNFESIGEVPETDDDSEELPEPDPLPDDEEDEDNENGDDEKDDGAKIIRPPQPIPNAGVNLFLTCVDLFVFELDDDILEKLILCAIISMSFDRFLNRFKTSFFPVPVPHPINKIEKQLDERVATTYNQFLLQVMTGIQTAKSKKDYVKQLFQSTIANNSKRRNLLDLFAENFIHLFTPAGGQECEELNQELDRIIRYAAVNFLYRTFAAKLAEFQNAVGIKVGCLQADLTFLSTEILRLTSANAGILQISNALALVTSARFAEDDDFEEIFDAVEEIADAIEDLAEIYQDRLQVLRALLPFSLCPRPLLIPEVPGEEE